jgi:hypothetical protein
LITDTDDQFVVGRSRYEPNWDSLMTRPLPAWYHLRFNSFSCRAPRLEPGDWLPAALELVTKFTRSRYDKAKVGIFIHWGIYSVPSFNIHNLSKAIKDGYAGEWYWWYLHGLPTPEVIKFHNET